MLHALCVRSSTFLDYEKGKRKKGKKGTKKNQKKGEATRG